MTSLGRLRARDAGLAWGYGGGLARTSRSLRCLLRWPVVVAAVGSRFLAGVFSGWVVGGGRRVLLRPPDSGSSTYGGNRGTDDYLIVARADSKGFLNAFGGFPMEEKPRQVILPQSS